MSTPTECCYASGGRASITINGVSVSPRSVMITPLNFERTVGSNQDGTIYTTVKPVPAEADITLSDYCGLDLMALMGCPIDVTIKLWDMQRTYLFSNAVMVGRPRINTETGEVSGLKITGNTVMVNAS